MSEAEDAPQKAVADPEVYRESLDGWMKRQKPEAEGIRVHDVDMPRATGFSNETVFFSASWNEAGISKTERFVARIEPDGSALFPKQTAECEFSVQVQHRIMDAVRKTGAVPMPSLLPFESDTSVLGRPFFVMEFIPGVVPADVPRYSQAGFLVDEATEAERSRMVTSGVETMAALAGLDWKELGLSWLDRKGQGTPTLADQLELYRGETEASLGERDHPVLMKSLDWLDRNAPDAPAGLSWGDSRLGNMIWQDYRCASVCDWEAVSLCPPEADIGWWVMFDRQSFDDLDAPRLPGFPTREEMVSLWEAKTGRSVADTIDYWEIYGTMRFCAIMVPLGDRMARAGIVPAEAEMYVKNGTTDSLAKLLERQGA
ncbi:MAG: phosphotransferase family protein [Myxococcota bacterium]